MNSWKEKVQAFAEEADDFNNPDFNSPEHEIDLKINELKDLFHCRNFVRIGWKGTRSAKSAMRKLSEVYDKTLGLHHAAKIILKYDPVFIRDWADKFGWRKVCDKNNPFIQALNNPANHLVLIGTDWMAPYDQRTPGEIRWTALCESLSVIYESLESANDKHMFNEYIAEENAVIYNVNLYNLTDECVQGIISIDVADQGKHRVGFNKRLDARLYNEILDFGRNVLFKEHNS